jgi:hypothetical protein
MRMFLNHNKDLMLSFAAIISASSELCALKLCHLLIHPSKQSHKLIQGPVLDFLLSTLYEEAT